jgi:hypothetical protein
MTAIRGAYRKDRLGYCQSKGLQSLAVALPCGLLWLVLSRKSVLVWAISKIRDQQRHAK